MRYPIQDEVQKMGINHAYNFIGFNAEQNL